MLLVSSRFFQCSCSQYCKRFWTANSYVHLIYFILWISATKLS